VDPLRSPLELLNQNTIAQLTNMMKKEQTQSSKNSPLSILASIERLYLNLELCLNFER